MPAESRDTADLAARIREAIRAELRASSRGLPFRVTDLSRHGGLLSVALEPDDRRSVLDESMEDGRLGWESEPSGSADLISILPALSIVNATLTSGHPPTPGTRVFINPPRYLEALLALWEQPALAAQFVDRYFRQGDNHLAWDNTIPTRPFPGLRPAQIGAFSLPRWQTSFLWGPPGTGKTHTLGRLLAGYLVHHPNDRVLLLASTNVAVDLAILAVDDALAALKPPTRPVCYRFGSRLDPARFRGRDHLTPLRDKTLVQTLRLHQEVAPDPGHAEAYKTWKDQRDRLRDAIRAQNQEFLSRSRLAAMTTTLAAYDFPNLGQFDLVVFDEASQVGKAQALTFAHLGKRVLFAGDPQQLAPIAQAPDPDVTSWLASSPFAWIGRSSLAKATCMLNEQWRMAPQICSAVSHQFYESKLHVAIPAAADERWLNQRVILPTQLLDLENVVLIDTQAAPAPAKGFRGYHCPESARLIAALVADHVRCWSIRDPKAEILLLTPYRAQRRLLEQEMLALSLPSVLASTVHKAQGSERRLVFFDPVCPTADFIAGEAGMRLVNVAFSRAESRLIVMLQRGWQDHPVLRYLAKRHKPVVLNAEAVDRLLQARFQFARPQTEQITTAQGSTRRISANAK